MIIRNFCDCWRLKTANEKKIFDDLIKNFSKQLELADRQELEFTRAICCLGHQSMDSLKPI